MTESSTGGSQRLRHVAALDGVRGLSVLSVIVFHYGLLFGYLPSSPGWMHHVGALGLGVQMFFVLSGALITSLLVSEHGRTGEVSLKAFYLRRWRRLGPALVAILPLLVLAELLVSGGALSPLGAHPWLAVLAVGAFFGNWVLFTTVGGLGWIGPAWSLGVEEQFYLSWPLLLRAGLRRRMRRGSVLAGLAVALVASVAVAAWIYHHSGPRATYYASPTQLPCIIFGSALGYELTVNPRGRLARLVRSQAVAAVGVVGTVLSGYEITRHDHYLYRGGYVVFAVFACLVVGHCFVARDGETYVARGLAWRPLEAVGKVSYEAYLIHVPVIIGVERAFPHLHANAMLLLDSALVAVASAALYSLFDQPIRRLGWQVYLSQIRSAVIPAPRTPVAVAARATALPSSDGPSRLRYIPALDGMRGISLPGTILTHYALFFGFAASAPAWLGSVGPLTLNIQMFFVLSGALITSLLVAEHQRSGAVSLKSFYLRRSRRLGPALIATLVVIGAVELIWPGSRGSSPLGSHPWWAFGSVLVFVGNWVLFTYSGGLGWLGPAWTLGIEEQFYLTWPLLLRTALRRRARRGVLYLGFAVVLAAAILGAALIQHDAGKWRAFYATPVQLPSIMFGCALGYELTANPTGHLARLVRSRIVALLGLAGMVVTSIELVRHPAPLYVGGYGIYAAFACMLIGHCFVRAGEPTVLTRVLGWKPFVVIGQVSYEAYLIHVIVIIGLARAWPTVHVYPMMAIDAVVVATASALFYYTVEQPIRRRGWKAAFRRHAAAAGRSRGVLLGPTARWAAYAGGLAGVIAVTGLGVVAARTAGGAGPVSAAADAPANPVADVTPGHGTPAHHHPAAVGPSAPGVVAPTGSVGAVSGHHRTRAAGCVVAVSCVGQASYGVPDITRITPMTGPVVGGTTTVIEGVNFAPDAKVFFDGVRLQQVQRVDDKTLRVVTPPAKTVALSLGLTELDQLHDLQVAVTVRTRGGTSSVGVTDRFTYL